MKTGRQHDAAFGGPDRTMWVFGGIGLLLIILLVEVALEFSRPPPPDPTLDPGFIAATEEARRTYPVFLEAFRNPTIEQLDFRIRAPMTWEDEVHHVWLMEPILTTTSVVGRAESIRPGEVRRVECTPDEITDWMILRDDQTLEGGFVVRWERSRMSEKERQAFDRETGIRFEAAEPDP